MVKILNPLYRKTLLEAFIQNLVQNSTVVFEKIWLIFCDFCMYTTLGHGQEMTLTFNTHIPS